MDCKVTIAIASYNNSQYIERCVDSVIDQTYKSLDIMIVDDGSKDDTLSRIEKYKHDNRVRIIVKNNGGLSSVRQLCLDEAKGKYICFIDADDYLYPEYVKNLLSKIEYDMSDVCVCSTRFETVDGIILNNYTNAFKCPTSTEPIETSWQTFNAHKRNVIRFLFLSDSWNKMFRISSVKKTGVVFNMPQGLNGSDSKFNSLLALHALKYSTIEEVGYIHVIYKNSAVHRKNKNLDASFRNITSDMIKESKKIGIWDKIKMQISTDWFLAQDAVFEDIYCGGGEKVKLRDWYDLVNRQNYYAKQESLSPCSLGMAKTKKQFLFLIVYKYLAFLIPIYYKLQFLKR